MGENREKDMAKNLFNGWNDSEKAPLACFVCVCVYLFVCVCVRAVGDLTEHEGE